MFACWSRKSAADCRVSCFPEPSERRHGGWEAGVGATPNGRVPAGNHSRHRSRQPHHRTPQTEGKGEQTLRVTCFTGAVISSYYCTADLFTCLPSYPETFPNFPNCVLMSVCRTRVVRMTFILPPSISVVLITQSKDLKG